MVRVREGVDLKEFEKFGFKQVPNGQYVYIRMIENRVAYRVYITKKHRYLIIDSFAPIKIAGKLQDLLYDLAVNGLIEKEREEEETNE